MLSRSTLWLLALAICVNVLGAMAADDPLREIAVKEPPAFRSLLAAEAYQERQQKALAALGNIDALSKSELPAVGAAIVGIEPASQAGAQGLKVGDIVVRVNDKPVLWRDMPQRRGTAPVTLHYYQAATGTLKSAEVQPGRIGIVFRSHWRPELLFWRGKSRDPKWDRHVLVGITQRAQDADLAETAWQRAVAAGFVPDELSAQCGAEIALQQGRTLDAAKFALVAQRASKARGGLVSPAVLYRAALANYQLGLAKELAVQFPETVGSKPEVLQRLIDLHARRPQSERELPSAGELASTMYRDDLLPRLALQERKRYLPILMELKAQGRPRLMPGTDQYVRLAFMTQEPVRDVEFTTQFVCKAADERKGNYFKSLLFGIYAVPEPVADDAADDDDEDEDRALGSIEHRRAVLELQLGDDSSVTLEHSEADARLSYYGETKFDGRRSHEVKLLCAGGRGEIHLDGSRLVYVPLETKARRLAFVIKTVGMHLNLQKTRFVELVTKQE
jgi:hypothetical protein